MSDVNAVIVQPFKQFVKVRRAASKTSIAGGTRPPRRARPATTLLRRCRRRETHYATHTPPPRRRRRRATDPSRTQDSIHLVKKCTKPDRKEFARIASATMIGFLIMGFVGFFVKLVHIPINNILMT